jgi:cytochrome P450
VLRGHSHLDAAALHDRYGPVVRIGPNELSFITAQAFRDIYGLGSRFTKYKPRYITPVNGVDHLINIVVDADHARHRRLLSHAFSERALRDQEPLIRGYADALMSKLREMTTKSSGVDDDSITKVDIRGWINFTTFDTIGDLMFGESFNCLKDSQLHPFVSLNFESTKASAIMAVVNEYPLVNTVLRGMIPRHLKQAALDHFYMSAEKVDRRLQRGSDHPDFMSALLKNGLSEKDGQYDDDQRMMTRAELHSTGFVFVPSNQCPTPHFFFFLRLFFPSLLTSYSLILAGSETTGSLLSGCIYHLCKSADVTQRLVSEIRTAFTADEEITFRKTAKLPYLAAVVEESLRSYPPFVANLSRVTPAGGRMVDGCFVPENVRYHTNYDSRID